MFLRGLVDDAYAHVSQRRTPRPVQTHSSIGADNFVTCQRVRDHPHCLCPTRDSPTHELRYFVDHATVVVAVVVNYVVNYVVTVMPLMLPQA